jgi:peroxiredoxin
MRSKAFLIVFSALQSFSLSAQQVVIKGFAPTYKGSVITAYSYQDLITYTPVKVGSDRVTDSGRFAIIIPTIKQSQYLYLNINNQNGSIYITPGNTYHVIFPPPDSTHYQNPYVTHSTDLTFLISDSDNINGLIIDFNDQFDDFWQKHYLSFIKKQSTPVLDSFYVAMQHRYAKIQNPYFDGYVRYSIAELEVNTLEGPKTLGNKYLKGKPILYHNYEYMKFFNDYFNDYLEELSLGKQGTDVTRFIEGNDYEDLKEVLKINPLLKANDSLCELVLLKGLYEMYYKGDYQNNIKAMLNNIAVLTKINEDKIMAADILSSFSTVAKGASAPSFTLKDGQGQMGSSLDFRGRYLYLCFFKSNSETCLSELSVMAALYKKYGKKMYFVCVSEDDTYSDMTKFLEENKTFNWPFFYDEGGKILHAYDAKALPEFFLINAQGYFYQSPADGPSHGIEITFDRILPSKQKQPNQ